jgi:hypothetical protein
LLARPLLENVVKQSADIYSSVLYYAEGAELVGDVELSRTAISSLSSEQISGVMEKAQLPLPMGARITENIARETFAKNGLTTLDDYFNQTIVCVVINILALLILFTVLRLLFGFVIRGMEYGRGGFPVLSRGDGVIGAGVGLIHGVLILFVIFLIVPVMLTVLPKIYEFLSESFFGEFFYKANFLLSIIPST